jgi:SAM-dependent methyltransferase
MGTTLIFPAVTPEAAVFFRKLRKEGRKAITAASVACDEQIYGKCMFLPSVNAPEFEAAFLGLLKAENITGIFAPVASVHVFLSQFLSQRNLPIQMLNESPISEQVAGYRELLGTAQKLEPLEKLLSEGRSRLSTHAIAGIIRQARLIYGESNEEKIAAMMGVSASAVPGDVVEVGSLMGRTAAVLRLLSQRYAIGHVLTVDPWDAEEGVQHESPEFIQSMSHSWEPGLIADAFRINMLGMGKENFFHLQLPSLEGVKVYAHRPALGDHDFTGFRPSGKISVLHIDANHDFDAVRDDLEEWGRFLVPGGWLILDDYVWAHGDGPQRVGDAWLAKHQAELDIAFVCGKALFVRLKR